MSLSGRLPVSPKDRVRAAALGSPSGAVCAVGAIQRSTFVLGIGRDRLCCQAAFQLELGDEQQLGV